MSLRDKLPSMECPAIPRCHEALRVRWGILEVPPTIENRCLGYEAWKEGVEGFTRPRTG